MHIKEKKFFTKMILDKIDQLLQEVAALSAKNAEDIEQLRLKYLSKKGQINAVMADFRNVAADQKREVGMKINELKQAAQDKINELCQQIETTETGTESLDLTRTAYPIGLGTRHPLTIVKNEIIDIFQRMGFTLYSGPEIDDDQHVKLEKIIRILKESMSSSIFELLKRGDESYVVLSAHKNPRFVEDCVREIAKKVLAEFKDLPGDSLITIMQTNEESIHQHDAYAERQATMAELYVELNGEHS